MKIQLPVLSLVSITPRTSHTNTLEVIVLGTKCCGLVGDLRLGPRATHRLAAYTPAALLLAAVTTRRPRSARRRDARADNMPGRALPPC